MTASDWFSEGVKCFNVPDGIGAVRALEAVIKIDPAYRHTDGDNPYFYLGKIAEIEGRIDDGIVLYSRALALDTHDEESLIGRGSCYTVTKDHDLAIADFTKVLEIPPQNRNAPLQHLFYAIAENYRQKQDYSNALTWGDKALSEEPDNARHQQLVADVRKLMGGHSEN